MLTLTIALLLQTAPDEKEVGRLIEQLGADEPAARDEAVAALLAMGADILPILEKAEPGDPEVKARLKRVVAKLALPKSWAKDLLEQNPVQAYQKLEQAMGNNELDNEDAARILDVVLRDEACSPEMTQYMLNIAQNRRLRELWPTLVALAAEDRSQMVVNTLQRLQPPPEAADAILDLLPKLTNSSQVTQLLELVARMKIDPARLNAALDRLLSPETDESIAGQVMGYINNGRIDAPLSTILRCWRDFPAWRQSALKNALMRTKPDESVGGVFLMLESADPDETATAADYIAKHRIVEGAEPLLAALVRTPEPATSGVVIYPYYTQPAGARARILAALRTLKADELAAGWLDGGGPDPAHVIALVAELKLTALAPRVAERLGHADPEIRRRAASAVAALGFAGAADLLRERLKDEHAGVRADSLRALGRLEGAGATRTVLDQLLGGDADLQAAAIELLPQMDLDAVIDTLTTPENVQRYIVRYAIASLVASTDRAVLHRVMTRAGESLKAEDLHEMIRLIQTTRTR